MNSVGSTTVQHKLKISPTVATVGVVRAAVYARHSSTKQNARSCDEQIDRVRFMLGRGEVESRLHPGRRIELLPEWMIKDEAISGRSAAREGYQVLTDMLNSRKCPFEIIIVDDLTRLNRDLGNSLQLYQLAQFAGVEIVSVSDRLSSADPNARTFFTVKGMVGEMSNDAHAERTLRGMEMKIVAGFSCGDTPYGYKSQATRIAIEGSREVPRDFKILIDEEKAKIVRRIFTLFAEGHGRSAICRILNAEKIPWPGFYYKMPKGSGWSTTSVLTILTSQKYIGVWRWKKTKYLLNPQSGQKIQQQRPEREWIAPQVADREDLRIVSQRLWNRVQQTFEQIHACHETHGHWGRFRSSVPLHMLSGLLKCSTCGGNMIVASGSKGGFYGCFEACRKGTCSNKRMIRRVRLEKAIIEHLTSYLAEPELFTLAAQHYNRAMNDRMAYGKQHLQQYESELAQIGIELKHAAEAVLRGGDSKTLTQMIQDKEQRERYLKQQIRQIAASSADKIYVTPAAMQQKFRKLVEAMRKLPAQAAEALRVVLPEGLKLSWDGTNWHISGRLLLGKGSGVHEMAVTV